MPIQLPQTRISSFNSPGVTRIITNASPPPQPGNLPNTTLKLGMSNNFTMLTQPTVSQFRDDGISSSSQFTNASISSSDAGAATALGSLGSAIIAGASALGPVGLGVLAIGGGIAAIAWLANRKR